MAFTFANRSTSAVQATITTYQSDGTPVRILQLCTGGLISTPPPLDLTLDIPSDARRGAFSIVNPAESDPAQVHLEFSSRSEVTATAEISVPPMNSVSGSIAEPIGESRGLAC